MTTRGELRRELLAWMDELRRTDPEIRRHISGASLLAVLGEDQDEARRLLRAFLPSELHRLQDDAETLANLCAEELADRAGETKRCPNHPDDLLCPECTS